MPEGSELAQSLAEAVDFVRGEFGDQAATAFMGLVYKGVGQGEVTEANLGKGLLQGVRFLDGNFGFAAGDKALAHFNGSLNESMNEYFQNGLNEQFYASTWDMSGQVSLTLDTAETALTETLGQESAASIMDTLKAMLEDTENDPASLQQSLEDMAQVLQENGLLTGDAGVARLLGLPISSDAQAAAKGAALDLTV